MKQETKRESGATGKWEVKPFTEKDFLDGLKLVKYYADEHSKKIIKLEEDYLRRKIAEDAGWSKEALIDCCKEELIALVNFEDYEIHIQQNEVGTWSDIKSIYNKKKKKYVCTYEVVKTEERTKDGYNIILTIQELPNPLQAPPTSL